ncbi:MAG TPA: (2Fe-2S)-binding protein [Dehalococcoidia bacterium]
MKQQYELLVNGVTRAVETEPYQTLLDTLRDLLGLTGSKKGCNEGECASCTVLLAGKPVNSCLVLIGDAAGKDIVTIEGIAHNGTPHPLQQSFVELGGAQCGFCTPGFVVSAYALLQENARPSDDEIKLYLAGNICRCTGYNKIVAAVRQTSLNLPIAR